MSRAKTVKSIVPALMLAGITACASSGAESALSAEEKAYQDAILNALEPATDAEKEHADRSDPITRANFWANEYQKDNTDLETTIRFMSALRGINSNERVVEIATISIPMHPESHELYLEMGRAFLADGKPNEAAQVLLRSADLSPPDAAAPLAALGLAFDRMEDHEQAQRAYQFALERDPNRVSTLSNYGLSLALSGKLSDAEMALRRAAALPNADVRVRQNLALILGLQGRFDEMEAVDPNAPPRSVEANQRALREMIAPSRSYEDLMMLDDVVDELERTPSQEQEMPGVPEADVESEIMPEPMASEPTLIGGNDTSPSPTRLRPSLRGAQDS